jgi:hypothetical protein
MTNDELQQRAIVYAQLWGFTLELSTPLGHGQDGAVWRSSRNSAVKALERVENYRIEKECYQRFLAKQATSLEGFEIPKLIGVDDDLRVIEMRIVTPPFLLDFAKAWLDAPKEWPEGVLEDWESDRSEMFDGEPRWSKVKELLAALESFGIYYYDVKPGNIMFGDEDSSDL